MNFLSGLEKFGLDTSKGQNLFEEEKKAERKAATATQAAPPHIPAEDEFLLEKHIQCKSCDKTFKTIIVRSGKVKRMEPDGDLRPRTQYIDTMKYGVTSCPHCGYTALNQYFEHISLAQLKLIREEISRKFKASPGLEGKIISYDVAVDRHKLSLINTMVKRGKSSEKAYTCLRIAWLLRGKWENMPEETEEEKKAKELCKQEGDQFYQQAYEGFIMATAKEMFPMCGMDQSTVDYLLSYMSYYFKKFEVASKYLGSVITSPTASRRMKDMALELKEKILAELKR